MSKTQSGCVGVGCGHMPLGSISGPWPLILWHFHVFCFLALLCSAFCHDAPTLELADNGLILLNP